MGHFTILTLGEKLCLSCYNVIALLHKNAAGVGYFLSEVTEPLKGQGQNF